MGRLAGAARWWLLQWACSLWGCSLSAAQARVSHADRCCWFSSGIRARMLLLWALGTVQLLSHSQLPPCCDVSLNTPILFCCCKKLQPSHVSLFWRHLSFVVLKAAVEVGAVIHAAQGDVRQWHSRRFLDVELGSESFITSLSCK